MGDLMHYITFPVSEFTKGLMRVRSSSRNM